MNVREYPDALKTRAVLLRLHGADDRGARILENVAFELESILTKADSELLTPAQAALESGFSQGHILRLLQQHPELNQGRKFAPRIRRADLPKKARPVASAPTESPSITDLKQHAARSRKGGGV